MSQLGQITFYTHPFPIYGHRVHIALEEAKAEYTVHIIDIVNKPAWYLSEITPSGKLPAITYGGPTVPPDAPSPLSAKIPESLVIIEFLADLFPSASLRPSDPVNAAHARLFCTLFDDTYVPAFRGFFFDGAPEAVLLAAFGALQARLPQKADTETGRGFAVGEWSIIAAGPLLVRTPLLLANEVGRYPVGAGKTALASLRAPEYARIMKYIDEVAKRPSFARTYDAGETLHLWKNNPAIQREQP